jgi:hypothetical protein
VNLGGKGDLDIGPQRRRSAAVRAVALLYETMKQLLWHPPAHVVHHVDLGEVPWRFWPTLGLEFQPHFGECPVFQAGDDVGDGACSDGLEHDLHRGRAVVPVHVQLILGGVEARHLAAPGPMDFGLHANA